MPGYNTADWCTATSTATQHRVLCRIYTILYTEHGVHKWTHAPDNIDMHAQTDHSKYSTDTLGKYKACNKSRIVQDH